MMQIKKESKIKRIGEDMSVEMIETFHASIHGVRLEGKFAVEEEINKMNEV